MKIKEKYAHDEEDGRAALEIVVVSGTGKKTSMSFYDGEPEDNSIGRNFNDVLSIVPLMRLAHEAGARGESLEVLEETVDWEDL